MPRTCTPSGTKSTPLSKNSIKNLNPEGETNFWTFYLKNQQAVDKIIDYQLQYILDEENRKDIRQEVLFALHRCNSLSMYDPTLAAFHTYFTNTVKGHIQRQYFKFRTNVWRPYLNGIPEGESNDHRYKRAYYQSFNGILEKDTGTTPEDISLYDSERVYDFKDTLLVIRSKLKGQFTIKVFDLILKGFTKTDIANILNVKPWVIGTHAEKINAVSSKLAY